MGATLVIVSLVWFQLAKVSSPRRSSSQKPLSDLPGPPPGIASGIV